MTSSGALWDLTIFLLAMLGAAIGGMLGTWAADRQHRQWVRRQIERHKQEAHP
jgi:uncharacterized membrane protein YfcA